MNPFLEAALVCLGRGRRREDRATPRINYVEVDPRTHDDYKFITELQVAEIGGAASSF